MRHLLHLQQTRLILATNDKELSYELLVCKVFVTYEVLRIYYYWHVLICFLGIRRLSCNPLPGDLSQECHQCGAGLHDDGSRD